MPQRTVIRSVALADAKAGLRKDMDLLWEGDVILHAGPPLPEEELSGATVIDGRGKLAVPGFANTHTHVPMVALRGFGSDLNLQDWLHTKIFRRKTG